MNRIMMVILAAMLCGCSETRSHFGSDGYDQYNRDRNGVDRNGHHPEDDCSEGEGVVDLDAVPAKPPIDPLPHPKSY